MKPIVVYSGPNCPYCDRAKLLLKKKGVTFEEFNVRSDSEKLAEMMQKTNGKRSIPQIFIGEQHIGGCDDLYALESAGKLDALLTG